MAPEFNSYRFERFHLDLRLACLRRDDAPVALRRKSFDVLLYLVRNQGRVVSKDELMQAIWAGVVVTDNSLAQCIKEIREALGDASQAIIATSARRGYVFVPPVQASIDSDAHSAAQVDAPPLPRPARSRILGAAAAAVAALLALAGLWMAGMHPGPVASTVEPTISRPRSSVAVLPFGAPGGVDYFSTGISADIAGALGRFPDLAIASPDVISHLRSAGASSEEIQRGLKVRYLVEGDVLRSPERIRIAVRLTDLPRATLLWSESYDVPAADVMAIQDQITAKVAGALAVKLTRAEQRRVAGKSPRNMEAYDFVLRGRERLSHLNRTALSEARAVFERAIALDPTYAPAYVGLGRVDLSAAAMGWTADAEEALRHAQDAALRAISLDELDPRARGLLGRTYARMGQYDRAVETLKRAVALNRSEPDSLAGLGDALLWSGDPAGAIEALESAQSMDPRLPTEDLFSLGAAYLVAGKSPEAIRVLERATQRDDANAFLYALLAAAYGNSGRASEARSAVAQVRTRNPFFDLDDFGSLFRKTGDREKISSALKAAGL